MAHPLPPPPTPYPGWSPPPPWHGAPQPPETAPWGLRVVAYVIDVMLTDLLFVAVLMGGAGVGLVVGEVASPSADGDTMPPAAAAVMAVTLVVAFVVCFTYWWLPHARSGRTVGKRLMGIRVVAARTGTPPSVPRALGRYLFLLVFSLPVVTFFLDCLWPLWDPRGQSLHDKVAGTFVIRG